MYSEETVCSILTISHSHFSLIHWGWPMRICISKLTIIGSDDCLSPGRCQAVIWTNAGILWIGPLGTNLSEILIEILTFSFKKMHLKISSVKWRRFCLGLIVLSTNKRHPIACLSRQDMGCFCEFVSMPRLIPSKRYSRFICMDS